MNPKLLVNPFERIAGWQALIAGVLTMALTAVFSALNHISFYGNFYVNPVSAIRFDTALIMQAIDYVLPVLMMWLAGICFSKSKVRLIDVAGTVALTRIPMLVLAVVAFLPFVKPAGLYDIPNMIIFGIFCIPLMIWMIALLYNAFSVSCNMKGGKAVIPFIGALVIAEIIARIVLFILLANINTTVPVQSDVCRKTEFTIGI